MNRREGTQLKPRAAHPPSAHAGRTCLPALCWESARRIEFATTVRRWPTAPLESRLQLQAAKS